MSTIQDAYVNALLADATYALNTNLLEIGGASLADLLTDSMTRQVALYIAKEFSLVTHIETSDVTASGFAASVWRDTDGKLYVSMNGTEGVQDVVADIQLASTGNVGRQMLDMINWWLRITTPVGRSARQIKLGASVLGSPLIEATSVNGGGLISASDLASGIKVNGHSLGGYLASAFARLFVEQAHVEHTSTFNSAGFARGSEAVFQAYEKVLGPGYGAGRSPNEAQQTNYFAEHGVNFTASSTGFLQVGQRVSVFVEESTNSLANHSMYKITDALALANAMATLDPTMTLARSSAALEYGSSTAQGDLEGVLDSIRRLLKDPASVATLVGDARDSAPTRIDYYANLLGLQSSIEFASVSGKVRVDTSNGDLRGKARADFSSLVSLLTFSSVALTGLDSTLDGVLKGLWGSTYTDWQADKSLSQSERAAGNETFTDRWLKDRAEFLDWMMVRNGKNLGGILTAATVGRPIAGASLYADKSTGMEILLAPARLDQRRDVTFGSDKADTLGGQGKADDLYGGTGNDTLDGQGGDDYLEGNAGNDNLKGGDGSDILLGGIGDDILEGGIGDDLLLGGKDKDTYVVGRGYGADLVQENDATVGNTDLASFLAGIGTDQIWFRHLANDLEVSVIGTADKITVQNWYLGSQYHVEQFKTSNGKTLLDSKVQDLVSAMAAFAPPAFGQTTLTSSYATVLLPVIAADWGP